MEKVGGGGERRNVSWSEELELNGRLWVKGLTLYPLIASKGTLWQVLTEKGCGWWVDTSEIGLSAGLNDVLRVSAVEREEMAERARALVVERYSWKASAEKVVELYEKGLGIRS